MIGIGDFEDEEDEPAFVAHVPVVRCRKNPIVAVILGPDGEVLRAYRARPPVGYR